MKSVERWERLLAKEGFGDLFVWQDGPNAYYPEHTHPCRTAHVILEGEMTLTSGGRTATHKPGDRVDVPANTVHSARMGLAGCRYMIGEE